MSARKPTATRTLTQFARDKKKVNCAVCKLPEDVRDQLKEASNKKIPVSTQVEWLRTDVDAKITAEQLSSHRSGHHDV